MYLRGCTDKGSYCEGRLMGITGSWEDGAALYWSTRMVKLGLEPWIHSPGWNRLVDSSGTPLYGTKKSALQGIRLRWKRPPPADLLPSPAPTADSAHAPPHSSSGQPLPHPQPAATAAEDISPVSTTTWSDADSTSPGPGPASRLIEAHGGGGGCVWGGALRRWGEGGRKGGNMRRWMRMKRLRRTMTRGG